MIQILTLENSSYLEEIKDTDTKEIQGGVSTVNIRFTNNSVSTTSTASSYNDNGGSSSSSASAGISSWEDDIDLPYFH